MPVLERLYCIVYDLALLFLPCSDLQVKTAGGKGWNDFQGFITSKRDKTNTEEKEEEDGEERLKEEQEEPQGPILEEPEPPRQVKQTQRTGSRSYGSLGTSYGSMGTSAGSGGGKKGPEEEKKKKKTVGATDWESEAWEEGWGGGDWETGQQAKTKEQAKTKKETKAGSGGWDDAEWSNGGWDGEWTTVDLRAKAD